MLSFSEQRLRQYHMKKEHIAQIRQVTVKVTTEETIIGLVQSPFVCSHDSLLLRSVG
jgi:hypothetical protein